ncbi:MAG: UDP-N-acetylglucosamine 2-epimerase (non-hydrolyzing) [Gammaproteobacteria bacterium]|nr:UDP-N-acetylglucosamine 2-epimerase (non-hydrolyzing) [Gammaproteobacteria bacterium]
MSFDAKNLPKNSLVCVVGARPNFMKIAPIIRAIKANADQLPVCLIHTGQHYDDAMNKSFFNDLEIPEPDINLEVGSGSHTVQTAQVMLRFEVIVEQIQPRGVLVVGDVNSTIACALVAAKKNIPIIHVEAGLRSYDRLMPEEINRVLTDQLSDYLYTTEASAKQNLLKEGISAQRVHFVGNVMIDSLLFCKEKAANINDIMSKYAALDYCWRPGSQFAVLTLHRPSNVDQHEVLERIINVLGKISEQLPVFFTVHPRTKHRLEQFGLDALLKKFSNIICLQPLSYLEMLGLLSHATVVLTDSGGLQEETTALGVPCITLRENTERPVTVDQGTNTIVGSNAELIMSTFDNVMTTGGKKGRIPDGWDGNAAQRIAEHLLSNL